MASRLAANLNFLFTEGVSSISDRIRRAHAAGFRAVEIPFPNLDLQNVIQAKKETGIQIALINIDTGDSKFGTACLPNAKENFKLQLNQTIQFAKAVDCKKIHIMAGLREGDANEHLIVYKQNLKYSSELLEEHGIVAVIEPINGISLPNYFMNSFEIACDIIREINSKHLRLMVDIFHLQHIRGNITHSFAAFKDIIGHIQIAQVPHRHEPDVAGELDFSYIFGLIKTTEYKEWIGCEYKPKTTTLEGLDWIKKYEHLL